MGQIFTTIEVFNHGDEIDFYRHRIPAEQIRHLTVEDVFVDTGATHLCLPEDLVECLGLEQYDEVTVHTDEGYGTRRIYKDVNLKINGREDVVRCIALPKGARPLLGAIPMELLGIQPNLATRSLHFIPLNDHSSYLYV
jgi:predicted aspartyl protease